MGKTSNLQHGLKENLPQFVLLVVVNAFVGGMIGMERTIFPQFAEEVFSINSKTAILSFIVAFGIAKSLANYFTGKLANRFGRKKLLIVGWLLAIPVPILLLWAKSWNVVVFANVLLGISQGLTWSSTVVMKIDLVGEKQRGFAMGLNEFAGYLAVGLMAYLTGVVAEKYGVTPYPFYIGIVISVVGLALSVLWVKDTTAHNKKEAVSNTNLPLKNVFTQTTFSHKTLSSITQAGLVNNLNDGMIWGLLPIVLASLSFNTGQSGLIAAAYPAVWGMGQLFTGKLSDTADKKAMLFWGMMLQGIAILCIPFTSNYWMLLSIAVVLGVGTALVYPTFLAAIAVVTTPSQRAESLGIFRLWRDLGYAIGAIVSGVLADVWGLHSAIISIGIITVISSLIIQIRMPKMNSK
jgi:MFS family permease